MVRSLALSMSILATVCCADEFDALRTRIEAIESRVSAIEGATQPGDVIVYPGDKLAAKIASAKPGQTVVVLPGTYGPVLADHWVPNITVQGKPGAKIVTGKEDYFGLQLAGPTAKGITIDGVTLDCAASDPTAGGVKATASIKATIHRGAAAKDITIKNCTILNSPSLGILVDSDASLIVEDTRIEKAGDYAVYCASSNCAFSRVTVAQISRWGMHVYREDGSPLRDVLVSQCDLWDSQGAIIYRGTGKFLANSAKRVVIGGSSRKWTVSKNKVQRIQPAADTETILSTTSGVADDNIYQ